MRPRRRARVVPELPVRVRAAAVKAARRRTGVVVGAVSPAPASNGPIVGYAGTRAVGGAAVAADTVFEIGSITKVFTALVLAQEVAAGRLRLDTPVRSVLPGSVRVPDRAGVAITLGHLATHRSGLPRSPVAELEGSRAVWRGEDPYASLRGDDLLRVLADTTLRRTPGTGRLAYSNTGAGLLGRALVHATGSADYGQMIRTRVCEPLGLADTGTRDQLEPGTRARLATGHHRGERPAAPWPLTGLPGAGALVSTVPDLLKFAQAQLAPESTPLAEAIALSQRPVHDDIALGWLIAPGDQPLLWHNGGTGGFRSLLGLIPGAGVAVAVLTNRARSVDLVGLGLLRELDQRQPVEGAPG